MVNDKKIRDAIKELREATGMTQQEFAVALGKSTPTVQRYENLVAPRGPELAKLVYIARRADRPDVARLFKEAAISGVHEELKELIREGDIDGAAPEKTAAERQGDKRRLSA